MDDALSSLMREYGDALYNFALALTADPDVAADCTQHAFVRAYEQMRKGQQVNRSWLYKVARNAATDWFRHRQRTGAAVDAFREVAAPATGVDDRTSRLRAALNRLSPDEREVLYLFTVDGFRAAEIGTMLGINAGAVRMRIFRARERLRTLYGDEL